MRQHEVGKPGQPRIRRIQRCGGQRQEQARAARHTRQEPAAAHVGIEPNSDLGHRQAGSLASRPGAMQRPAARSRRPSRRRGPSRGPASGTCAGDSRAGTHARRSLTPAAVPDRGQLPESRDAPQQHRRRHRTPGPPPRRARRRRSPRPDSRRAAAGPGDRSSGVTGRSEYGACSGSPARTGARTPSAGCRIGSGFPRPPQSSTADFLSTHVIGTLLGHRMLSVACSWSMRRAMITRMISLVPSRIWWTRTSRR